ncbi:MAG: c-type cytochrome [Gammaproteobacteria bacterium]|jgi:cytochrome c oxidase cbb3-type subunit 3|nr:c-type cytochrome [Gammaproteobacteria bacterium]MBT3724320.1 c-type cytochrome [Gammaproteobacteria bacterium]MBT4074969.1 c-type cytochrome [Gammaproteobacteria bacterium]MBT4193583.1 c-type cytochrome [Gammaproteobacteria bacterium]MBT4452024.1 c-type cytochrome [Gammaproteobacteria bacterium]
MHKLLLLLFFSIFTTALFAAPDGHKLYTKHCSVCHNENGMGGIGLPLNGEKVEHFPRDYLFKTVRLGREGRVMPAFNKLSDAQINSIVDYIFSWKKNTITDVYSTKTVKGDANNGQKLFLQKCASCHGKDGKSEGMGTGVSVSRERKFQVVPPALNNPGFLASANDDWIRQTIKTGRPGTIMPSQATFQITDQELNDIVSYVRSFESSYRPPEALEEDQPTLVFDSPYDFMTTIANLKQSLQGLNFRYFPDRYMEMGLAPDKLINKKQLSLRFCNFKQLYKMINTEPRLGVVLPCRVTVVEQPDGQIKLYVMNMKVVSRIFNNTQLSETAEEMHEALMELIDEATL